MKYIIRAIKYFIYILILASIIIVILTLWQGTSLDVNTLFVEGMTSVYKIMAIFAIISAIYPAISYQKRTVSFEGEWKDIKGEVVSLMVSRRFKLEKDNGNELTFIASSPATRLLRMYEDRITMQVTGGVILIEGHRRDLVRIISGIEDKLR